MLFEFKKQKNAYCLPNEQIKDDILANLMRQLCQGEELVFFSRKL